MSKVTTILLFVTAFISLGCQNRPGPARDRADETSTSTAGTMRVRELSAPARIEGTIEGDLNQLPNVLARLQQFAAEMDSRPVGPPVLLFARLNDVVDSALPLTEVYLPAAAWPGMPEGGDDIAIVRTVSCRIASRMVQGSLQHPLPELLELKQWADSQGLQTELVPGAILHNPEAPLDNQQFELFYPIRPQSALPSGTYSLCSPSIRTATR